MNFQGFLLYKCGLMKLRIKQKAHRFKQYYSDSNPKQQIDAPEIIYMADGRISPGGLGDRLHGVISLYLYCKEKGYKFKANFCHPFRLKDYLLPNKVDWDIDPEKLSYNTGQAKVIPLFCTYKKYGMTVDEEAKYQRAFLDSFIKKDRKQYHIYTNAHFAYVPKVYSKAFHELFMPAKPLEEAISQNKENIGGEYIAIVLRFQSLLGDFKEANFPTLPVDQQEKLMEKVYGKIQELYSERHKGQKVLITSDSRKFLDYVSPLDYVYTIPGRVVHLTYTPDHDYTLHLKSFVDLMMLADAQKIYLLVTGDMFHSGFAQSASFINDKPYEEIIF